MFNASRSVSPANATRGVAVARAEPLSKKPTYLDDLDSLRTTIQSASRETLSDPNSDCRRAMTRLAVLAAKIGPMGDAAREELCDLYTVPPDQMDLEVRIMLLNTAVNVAEPLGVEASPTVIYMAGRSPDSPVGRNGDGLRDELNKNLASQLDIDEPNLFAEDRLITGTELLAASASLKNLNVWRQPISLSTGDGKQQFIQLRNQAQRGLENVTAWVSAANGNHIPVVAEPLADGGTLFHVIAPAGDELGLATFDALSKLFEDASCDVELHVVERPHLALKHLDESPDRGVGGVIQEHAAHWASIGSEDRLAINLASQANLFEAVVASRSQGAAQVATPDIGLHQPPAPPIVVKLPAGMPGVMQTDAPLQPMPTKPASATRAEMKTLASAMGFLKDDIGQVTNIWGEMSGIMNVNTATRDAGVLERRRVSAEVNRRLNEVPESNKRLAAAVMKASTVPSTLAKSPLWAHLDNVRGTSRARHAEELSKAASSGAIGVPQTVRASILETKALAVEAFPAQFTVRLMLLSTEIAKRAAHVTSNDPADTGHKQFKALITETESYVRGLGQWIEEGIGELDSVLMSTDSGVTEKMRADAKTMREALDGLRATFKDPEGVPQQVLNFTKAALASPDSLQQAADALIV